MLRRIMVAAISLSYENHASIWLCAVGWPLQGRWGLAPTYDLVSTQALKVYSPELGFAVGDSTMPGAITKRDWHAMAEQCGITKGQIVHEVRRALATLSELHDSSALRRELEKRGVDSRYWRKLEQPGLYIARQSRRIERQLVY